MRVRTEATCVACIAVLAVCHGDVHVAFAAAGHAGALMPMSCVVVLAHFHLPKVHLQTHVWQNVALQH